MPSRRGFLAGLATASLLPQATWADLGQPSALSAARSRDGSFHLAGLTAQGALAFTVPLPARGHAAAAHPTFAEAVAIARRPGTFAKVIDCVTGRVLRTLDAPEGHHFYGHGAFSGDGTLLFTTENHIHTGAGIIGVWDRSLGYRRAGAFPSGGIGPHEVLRLPSGALAVANGGIRTHPDSGRKKLNINTMRANLSIFDAGGGLLDQVEVAAAQHQNSLRHIAAAPDGRVFCGFQWQDDPYDAPGLVALYDGGQLTEAQTDVALQRQLSDYIGSVCAFDQGRQFAASSPRGGVVMIFDRAGQLTGDHKIADVCGLTAQAQADHALATDGLGRVHEVTARQATLLATHPMAFDNHLMPLHPA